MASENRTLPPELEEALGEAPVSADRARAVWDALGSVASPRPVTPTTEEAWLNLQQRLRPETPSRRVAPDRPARPILRRMKVLVPVSALVVLLVVGLWWQQPLSITVAPGSQESVELPDGSIAELNSASRLTYRRGFETLPFVAASERMVYLDGEGFFSVVRDETRPFIVETADARVEVLGTRFNVRARDTATGSRTVVTLQDGRVQISAAGDSDSGMVLDSVGASVVIQSGQAPERAANSTSLDHILAWRTNGFAAVDEPVREIFREVQRRFSVGLEVDPALSLDSASTVFYPRGTSAEEIIHDLCLSWGWNYRETSRGFQVFAAERTGSPANTLTK